MKYILISLFIIFSHLLADCDAGYTEISGTCYYDSDLEVLRKFAENSGIENPPDIFRVNWFRMNAEGKFLWPGFGENLRALRWVIGRVHGELEARETEIGFLPYTKDIDTTGINVSTDVMDELLSVDRPAWVKAAENQREFFRQFGERLPLELWDENRALDKRLVT